MRLEPTIHQPGVSVGGFGEGGVVRHGDDGLALFAGQIAQDLAHIGGGNTVEPTRGLIGEDDQWIIGQRAGNGHVLTLSTGQSSGSLVAMIVQPQIAEQLRCSRSPRSARSDRRVWQCD